MTSIAIRPTGVPPPRAHPVLLVWSVAVATGLLWSADEARADEGAPQRLIFLAPSRPIVIRVRLQVDEDAITRLQTRYAEKLFASLDADEDGMLDEKEAGKIPQFERLGLDPPEDAGLEKGRIARSDFVAYIRAVLGNPLKIEAVPQRATQQAGLFRKLDRDGNGVLLRTELQETPTTLRKLDLNGDGAFTLDELRSLQAPPEPGARDRRPAPRADDLPLHIVPDDEETRAALAGQLSGRYASAAKETSGESGTGAKAAASARELARLLEKGEPDLELLVRLRHRTSGRPQVRVRRSATPPVTVEQQARPDRLDLLLDGIPVELRVKSTRTAGYDARQLYKLRFRTSDGDRNGYLDREEFGNLSLPGVRFNLVDRDGDGKVFREELVAYVDLKAETARTRAELRVRREGQSLFEILDTDVDRRLAPRELLEAAGKLAEFDRDGNGRLASVELSGKYRFTIAPGRPGLLQSQTRQEGAAGTEPRIPESTTAGPLWFRKMDRNRDGDVARREFLGPPEAFDRLDADSDGLIDADEAEAAGE